MVILKSGLRGIPAKDVGHLNNDARVRIPLATLVCLFRIVQLIPAVLKTASPARARGSEAHNKRQQNGLQFAVGDKSEVKL